MSGTGRTIANGTDSTEKGMKRAASPTIVIGERKALEGAEVPTANETRKRNHGASTEGMKIKEKTTLTNHDTENAATTQLHVAHGLDPDRTAARVENV